VRQGAALWRVSHMIYLARDRDRGCRRGSDRTNGYWSGGMILFGLIVADCSGNASSAIGAQSSKSLTAQ